MFTLRPKVVTVLLAVAVVSGGCQGAATSPAASPVASKACGGYHLAIQNHAATSVQVLFNRQVVATAEPGQTTDLAQWGNRPVPPMPWDVEVRRGTDQVLLVALRVEPDGSDGRRLTVTDPPGGSPLLAAYVCGSPSPAVVDGQVTSVSTVGRSGATH